MPLPLFVERGAPSTAALLAALYHAHLNASPAHAGPCSITQQPKDKMILPAALAIFQPCKPAASSGCAVVRPFRALNTFLNRPL